MSFNRYYRRTRGDKQSVYQTEPQACEILQKEEAYSLHYSAATEA